MKEEPMTALREVANPWRAGCGESRMPGSEGGVEKHSLAVRSAPTLQELGMAVHVECVLGTTHFYRGDALPEHEMVGVHDGCSNPDATRLQLSDEHGAYQWVTAEEAQALFPVGHWLRELIARAEVVRRLMPQELLQFYRHSGFEL
jgi:hypothetical protein